MYQTLIRPIITYACPVWFNISPSYMERIRTFERKCLRACTKTYRTPESGYMKYVSNKKLYEKANVIRIDNFMISIIRRHILRCTRCEENNLIMAPYYSDENYIAECLKDGFVPSEAFLLIDKKGHIQDANGIPIFYHRYRRANNKNYEFDTNEPEWRHSKAISQRDNDKVERKKLQKYWWIN